MPVWLAFVYGIGVGCHLALCLRKQNTLGWLALSFLCTSLLLHSVPQSRTPSLNV